MFWRKHKERPDYALIAKLEVECGFAEEPPMVPKVEMTAKVGYFLMSTDPSKPVLKHMWDGEG